MAVQEVYGLTSIQNLLYAYDKFQNNTVLLCITIRNKSLQIPTYNQDYNSGLPLLHR